MALISKVHVMNGFEIAKLDEFLAKLGTLLAQNGCDDYAIENTEVGREFLKNVLDCNLSDRPGEAQEFYDSALEGNPKTLYASDWMVAHYLRNKVITLLRHGSQN